MVFEFRGPNRFQGPSTLILEDRPDLFLLGIPILKAFDFQERPVSQTDYHIYFVPFALSP